MSRSALAPDPSLPPGLQPAVLAAASARLLKRARWVGAVVVLGAHTAIGLAVILAPAQHPLAVEAAARAAEAGEDRGCASVVSPACLGEKQPRRAVPPPADDELPGSRRCPEPLRRLMRREVEPPPEVLVDLLEAEIVERLGEADGTRTEEASKPAAPPKTEQKRVETVEKLVRGADNKLDKILKGGDEGEARRNKLGKILGTKTGQRGGDGLVARSGSAYVREVRIAMQKAFVLPGSVPPWLRKELRAKVIVRRMTATGRVLEFQISKKSGNDAFDDTVRSLMTGYKAGIRSLPEPPPHVLEEINSRGLVVELRGG
ncbi:MAG: TonB C-terminal domain-containing protein [Deltaproteobacteria bacterium]|nr:TonB C-terminal domain-containing protein [Deltaproteobacteria bacterium]